MKPCLNIDKQRISEFCARRHIVRMALFGSALRDDFRDDSDADILVVFAPGHEPGLLRLSDMEHELSEILGRKADFRTPEDLSRLFRDEVLASARILYAA